MEDELTVVDALAQLSFLVQATLDRRAGEHDVSLIQARLLGILRDRRPTMTDLARLLDLDKSSVTGLVGRAEARGLVARAPSATDGRSTTVSLTAAGRRLIRTVSTRFEADVASVLTGLSATETRTLARLAGRVVVEAAAARGVDVLDVEQ